MHLDIGRRLEKLCVNHWNVDLTSSSILNMPVFSLSLRLPLLYVDHGSGVDSLESSQWTNKDLEPVPLNDRKWGMTALICYWISDAFNASSWQFGNEACSTL
jgi:hypothetical protein